MLTKRLSQKRHDNKSLYESIMKDISKVVKTCLNEAMLNWSDSDIDDSGIIKTDDTVKKISEDDIIRSPEDIYNKINPEIFYKSDSVKFKLDLSYLPWFDEGTLFDIYNIPRNTIISIEFEYFNGVECGYCEWHYDEDEIYDLFSEDADEVNDNLFEAIDTWLGGNMYEHLDLN